MTTLAIIGLFGGIAVGASSQCAADALGFSFRAKMIVLVVVTLTWGALIYATGLAL